MDIIIDKVKEEVKKGGVKVDLIHLKTVVKRETKEELDRICKELGYKKYSFINDAIECYINKIKKEGIIEKVKQLKE